MTSEPTESREIAALDPTLISVQSGTIQYRWLAGSWVMEDHAYGSKEMVFGQTVELLDEIRRLRRWKDEANAVLGYWDNAYERANIPGLLGDSKPTLMLAEIERLRKIEMVVSAVAEREGPHPAGPANDPDWKRYCDIANDGWNACVRTIRKAIG